MCIRDSGKLEKLIAKLDQEKKVLNEQLLGCSDASEALVLHDEFSKVSKRLEEAEASWLELSESQG